MFCLSTYFYILFVISFKNGILAIQNMEHELHKQRRLYTKKHYFCLFIQFLSALTSYINVIVWINLMRPFCFPFLCEFFGNDVKYCLLRSNYPSVHLLPWLLNVLFRVVVTFKLKLQNNFWFFVKILILTNLFPSIP